MGVIAFEIVKNDWECATWLVKVGVAFMAKSAAEGPSDVAVVANFFVCVSVEFSVTAWAMCACIEVILFLCVERCHVFPCHLVVVFV